MAKLVGAYERELASIFTDATTDRVRTFVDVGCADGYYAVGLPVVAREVTTFAFDLSRSARNVCSAVASLNDVAGRVRIGKRFSETAMQGIPGPDLLLCDIEGGEADLFTDELVRHLDRTRVVIEVHEDTVPGVGDRLSQKFAATHRVRTVPQEPREADGYPQLREFTAEERTLALSEHRSLDMWWLDCVPRSGYGAPDHH